MCWNSSCRHRPGDFTCARSCADKSAPVSAGTDPGVTSSLADLPLSPNRSSVRTDEERREPPGSAPPVPRARPCERAAVLLRLCRCDGCLPPSPLPSLSPPERCIPAVNTPLSSNHSPAAALKSEVTELMAEERGAAWQPKINREKLLKSDS